MVNIKVMNNDVLYMYF